VRFIYRAWDGFAWTTAATVTVAVVPDTAPVVTDMGLTVRAGETAAGRLDGRDAEGDPFVYVAEPPAFGRLDIDPSSGAFVYTPPAGFSGTVTFRYGVFSSTEGQRWGHGWSDLATVTIIVEAPPNLTPSVSAVELNSQPRREVRGTFAGHDPDGGPLVYEVVAPPEVGTVEVDGDGFVWRRSGGWGAGGSKRTIAFTYRAWDGSAFSDPATVTITFGLAEEADGAEPPNAEPPKIGQPKAGQPEQNCSAEPGPPTAPITSPAVASNNGVARNVPYSVTSTAGDDDRNAPKPSTSTAAVVVRGADAGGTQTALPLSPASYDLGNHGHPVDGRSPVPVRHADIDGDGQDDLDAVFGFDWTKLWDGPETTVSTGSLAGVHEWVGRR